jgi:hypothetical protein
LCISEIRLINGSQLDPLRNRQPESISSPAL